MFRNNNLPDTHTSLFDYDKENSTESLLISEGPHRVYPTHTHVNTYITKITHVYVPLGGRGMSR